MTTTNFLYTGSAQTFTVPAGVSVLKIDMNGGAAERLSGFDSLGYGDRLQFSLAVTPGDVLTIYVGQDCQLVTGSGTYNGHGGNGYSGGGGGGAQSSGGNHAPGAGGSSAILKSGTLLAEAGGGYTIPFSIFGPGSPYGYGGGGGYFGQSGYAGAAIAGYPTQYGGGGGGSQGGNGGAGAGSGGTGGTGVNGATHAGGGGSSTGPGYNGGTAYYVSGTTAHFPHNGSGASWATSTGVSGVVYTPKHSTGYVSITTPIPQTPTLLSPTNGSTHPADPPFSWDYTAAIPGNSMTGYVLRYKTLGAAAYSYYSGTWGSPSSTPVTISATAPGVTPTAGTFPVGSQYQWSVANVDQGGQSAFPPDAVWTSQNPPSVAITAPTGGTFNGSQTTITWTATAAGTASIASTRCVVKGPTGVTVADSGVMPGTLLFTTPSGLLNGTTYSITVTATDTSGESTVVTISATCLFDGPAVPRVWAQPTTDSVGTPVIEINVQSMDNLLTTVDSSFEGGSVGSWVTTGTGTALSGSVAKDGLYSLKLTSAGAGAGAITGTGAGTYQVSGGRLYCASAFFSAASTQRATQVGIQFYDAALAAIGSPVMSTGLNDGAPGTWQQDVLYAMAPVNAAWAAIVVSVTGPSAGEIHYVDEVLLVAGAPIGRYSINGTHVISEDPVFTPYDTGAWFGGAVSTGGATTCVPTRIATYVSANEVILSSTPGAAGLAGYVGPTTGGAVGGLPLWSIGSPSTTSIGIVAQDLVTGDFHDVRGSSLTNPFAISPGDSIQFNDYEVCPQHSIIYTVYELAVNNGAAVSTPSVASNGATLVTDRLWIFSPIDVVNGLNVVDVFLISGNFSRAEYLATHKQVGNPFLAVVSDTVGGISGSMTVRVVGAARWWTLMGGSNQADQGLVTSQATVCISDPLGGFYYGRLGLSAGGGSGAVDVASGSYVQADIANQVRDVGLSFAAQPIPPA